MALTRNQAVLAVAVLAAWACAKANDSNLGGGSFSASGGSSGMGAKPGTGGSSTTGGSSSGGSSGKGGFSASGGSSASGGTAAAGGSSATGGGAGAGGASASGGTGTGGTTGDGGAAGDDGIPPDVLANADVILYYQAKNAAESTSTVDMRLELQNKADDALDLSHVVVRYWMTAEPATVNTHTYYHAPNVGENVPSFVDDGKNSHLEITFASGSIPAHNGDLNATEFQATLDATGGDKYDQSDDWSFDGTATGNPQPNAKITVYLAGKLIWGCEPSGKCPVMSGAGGAGGEGGQGGQAGQAGQTGAGGTSGTSAGQGGEPGLGGQAGI